MKLDRREQNGAIVVALAGEVDLAHSPALRKVLMDETLSGRTVVVDLSGVEYIDSSGIAALVEGYQMAKQKSGRFALAAVSAPAARVLKLARLDQVFIIGDDIEAAIGGSLV